MSVSAEPAGVLPAEEIAGLISQGAVQLAGELQPRQLQPASLDLTVGRRGWRVRASFLPSRARTVRQRLDDGLLMHEIDLAGAVVLERGCVYVVELAERMKLPLGVCGAANPKSSTGRIDVFVRLVADGGAAFDEIPAGYEGPLYAEISPRTFSIVIRPGSSLNQLRLKRGDCRLADSELELLHARTPLIDATANIHGGIGLSVRLAGGAGEIVGWRGRRHAALIDVDRPGALPAEDYFEPIAAPKSGFIILDPDEFYILASQEALVVPPDYAAEMTPIDPGLGEFRVHYAGFFDPGFGWSGRPSGSRAVLEVRSHDAPFVLENGQLVARLVYERMAARPKRLYGEDLRSHYQGQGLKLSKHFR
ncbi:MAG: 2'-deoxycytidine 5'-triphosphate deaminase [Parvularculaceae bacterium]